LSLSTHSRILFYSDYFHYKIFIHEKFLENSNDKFQQNVSRSGKIDARARRSRNTGLRGSVAEPSDAVTQKWLIRPTDVDGVFAQYSALS
jgi:hypothetical protein